ncbi:MAG: hypothetical protein OES46_12165, partial [Gammaproteobacteria bacterium]|nr:hypothetical protein [Gammaproteobacteria bacterium]
YRLTTVRIKESGLPRLLLLEAVFCGCAWRVMGLADGPVWLKTLSDQPIEKKLHAYALARLL